MTTDATINMIPRASDGPEVKSIFTRAAEAVWAPIKKTGELAWDFFKTNPIVTFVGADLALTGGALSQHFLVSATKTVAGALGTLGSSAASGAWHWLLGSATQAAPKLALGGGGGW